MTQIANNKANRRNNKKNYLKFKTFLSSYKERLRDFIYKKFILCILSLGFFVWTSQFLVVTNRMEINLDVDVCRRGMPNNFTCPPPPRPEPEINLKSAIVNRPKFPDSFYFSQAETQTHRSTCPTFLSKTRLL